MFITTTITPDEGPGFQITAKSDEIERADLADVTARVLYPANSSVPVAFFVITIPPLGHAIYSPDFSSLDERLFLAGLCHVEFYDISLVRWEDRTLVTWMSQPINDATGDSAIIEELLQMPTPSHEAWDLASAEAAQALGLQ